jgi:hypothetical protein
LTVARIYTFGKWRIRIGEISKSGERLPGCGKQFRVGVLGPRTGMRRRRVLLAHLRNPRGYR